MRPPFLRSLALVGAACVIGACQTWTRHDVSPGTPMTVADGKPVRVTLRDNSHFTLRHTRVEGDSLIGDLVTDSGDAPRRSATALSDVLRVEEQRVSVLRTGGLVLGVTLVAASIVVIAAAVALLSSWN